MDIKKNDFKKSEDKGYITLFSLIFLQIICFFNGYSFTGKGSSLSELLFIISTVYFFYSLMNIKNNYYPFFKKEGLVTRSMKSTFHTIVCADIIMILNINAAIYKPILFFPVIIIISPFILFYLFLGIFRIVRRSSKNNN